MSFGQEGEGEQRLKYPQGIATNADGQFVVADPSDDIVKMYDSSGNFHLSFNPQIGDAGTKSAFLDVATDLNSNTYVLVGLRRPGAQEYEHEGQVFNKAADLQHRFPPVRVMDWGKLTVNRNNVMVLRWIGDKHAVDVYEHGGRFICNFAIEEGMSKDAKDITAANDDRVIILGDSCVHILTEEGNYLSKFYINIEGDCCTITCHPAGEHVVVPGKEPGKRRLLVAIYTTDGEFVRSIQLLEENTHGIRGITATMEGRIAVLIQEFSVLTNYKVIVL